MGPIQSGQIYKWLGLPGQYQTDRFIAVGSLSASCAINGYIFASAEDAKQDIQGKFKRQAESLCSISAADFVTAVEHGWLVLVP